MKMITVFQNIKNWFENFETNATKQQKEIEIKKNARLEKIKKLNYLLSLLYKDNINEFIHALETDNINDVVEYYVQAGRKFGPNNLDLNNFDVVWLCRRISLKQTKFVIATTSFDDEFWGVNYTSGPWDDDLRNDIIEKVKELKEKELKEREQRILEYDYEQNVNLYKKSKGEN